MLVLTRKAGQRVMLSNGVFVSVVRIQSGKVRLGIEAPDDVSIWREEVVEVLARQPVPAFGNSEEEK